MFRRIWVMASIRHESASKLNIMPRQRQNGSVPFIRLNASFLQSFFLLIFTLSSLSCVQLRKRFCWDVLSVKPFYRFEKNKLLLIPKIQIPAWQYAQIYSKYDHEYRSLQRLCVGVCFFLLVEGARDFGWFRFMSANRD